MSDEKNGCPNCGEDVGASTTTSADRRWKYTGTVLSILLIASLPVLIIGVGVGVISLAGVSSSWWVLYTTAVLMALTWTYGKETLEAVSEARGN